MLPKLSGGELVKLNVSQGLTLHPTLLLLDELLTS